MRCRLKSSLFEILAVSLLRLLLVRCFGSDSREIELVDVEMVMQKKKMMMMMMLMMMLMMLMEVVAKVVMMA